MASGVDILHLFPDLAAIGQQQLQVYCDEWVRRRIARGVAQIEVDENFIMHIRVDPASIAKAGDLALVYIDELLAYIVDRHFADRDKRRQLILSIQDTKRRWVELQKDYEVVVGRTGTLYLTCKNPFCRAELETAHQAIEGQKVDCPPTPVTCPVCGTSFTCDGNDLHVRLEK